MRVLLTGATGFIGSHVARELIREGCLVTALVRPGADLHRIRDIRDSLHLLESDLRISEQGEAALESQSPDICLHLAWYTVPGDCLTSTKNIECLQDSIHLLRVLGAVGCRRVLMAGTSVEYDAAEDHVSENSPVRPHDLYGASKQALFLIGEQLSRQQEWSFASTRIFNVYGPWEDQRRLVADVIRKLLAGKPCDLTSGEQVRDYLHVEDVARAIWVAAKSDLTGPINIASSQPISVASLAREIGELLRRSELLRFGAKASRPGDPVFLCGNSQLLQDKTGWRPQYNLRDGLQQTIEWWKMRDQVMA